MAKEKCELCGKDIEKTFLNKPIGTIIKIKKNNENKFVYVCNECQKSKNIKQELSHK
ncbi:MAG: hypothetical protein ACP5D2_04840 [Candidatus Nanoarchaeia archaeon]